MNFKKLLVKKMSLAINDKFVRFSDIENSYNKALVEKYKIAVPEEELWVAMEKVHGANFSIYIDKEKNVTFGKRTSLMPTEKELKTFFDFSCIRQILEEKAQLCAEKFQYEKLLIIYGELIGNNSHPNLGEPMVKKGGLIQKDIPYTNTMEFVVFDIMIDYVYQPFSCLEKITDFPIVPIVKIGTVDECLEIDVDSMKSAIPSMFLLKSDVIKEHIVEVEGIVIKPLHEYKHRDKRVILKKKTKNFTEKHVKPKVNEPKTHIEKPIENPFLEEMKCYVNKNVVQSVISKHGGEMEKHKLIGLCANDVFETFKRDHSEENIEISKKNEKECKHALQKEFSKII